MRIGHKAKSVRGFRKDMTEMDYMIEINHRNFQRFKKVLLAIYRNYPLVNYTEQLLKNSPVCKILA